MGKPKVHIYQPVDDTGESYRRMEAAGITVKTPVENYLDAANRREQLEVIFDPDTVAAAGVANRSKTITRKSLMSAPHLRLIAKYTVGFDNVDVDAATELGVLVVHSPTETNWSGVAEGTVTNILAVLKKIRERDKHVKNGGWRDMKLQGTFLGARQIDNYPGITLGIIGLGRIGSRVADLFQPWRINIIACDPYVDESKFVLHNAKPVDLGTLLKTADVVTIHCNLTKETTRLIGARELGLMKPSAVLVNAARGPIVDIDALFEALDKRLIASAALDVLPDEPPDPQTPILGLDDRVMLSPHMISNNAGNGLKASVPWVEKAILDVMRGEVPRHVVNPEVLPLWRERFAGKTLI
ncbi:MAG: dehydrogenase [Alphaproteobacteria bacterium]|nr:dehydrogenase [Alphaproteobacteria bacterium]